MTIHLQTNNRQRKGSPIITIYNVAYITHVTRLYRWDYWSTLSHIYTTVICIDSACHHSTTQHTQAHKQWMQLTLNCELMLGGLLLLLRDPSDTLQPTIPIDSDCIVFNCIHTNNEQCRNSALNHSATFTTWLHI